MQEQWTLNKSFRGLLELFSSFYITSCVLLYISKTILKFKIVDVFFSNLKEAGSTGTNSCRYLSCKALINCRFRGEYWLFSPLFVIPKPSSRSFFSPIQFSSHFHPFFHPFFHIPGQLHFPNNLSLSIFPLFCGCFCWGKRKGIQACACVFELVYVRKNARYVQTWEEGLNL